MAGLSGSGTRFHLKIAVTDLAAASPKNKKADVVEHFDHVGLLADEPPGIAEVPFI